MKDNDLDNLFGGMADRARAVQEEQAAARAEALKKFKQDVTRLALTPEGKVFLGHLKDICGWSEPCTIYNPQTLEMNPMAIVYNQGRRNIWLEIRNYIPAELLADLEKPPEE